MYIATSTQTSVGVCFMEIMNVLENRSNSMPTHAVQVYLFWHLCCSYAACMCGMVPMCGEDSEDSAFQSIANRNYLDCSAARMMGMYDGVYCIRYGWMATIVSIYSISRWCCCHCRRSLQPFAPVYVRTHGRVWPRRTDACTISGIIIA